MSVARSAAHVSHCTHSNEKVAQKQVEALKGNAVIAMADACKALAPGEKLTLVGVGAFTNIALFVSVFPSLLLEKVSQIVLMGGAEGRGNKVSWLVAPRRTGPLTEHH